jgi:hypothetical protein
MSRRHPLSTFVASALLAVSLLAPSAHAALPLNVPLADAVIQRSKTQRMDLKEYRGKVLVVAIMSGTCRHCVETLFRMNTIQTQLGTKNLQFVALLGDDHAEDLLPFFVEQYKPLFPMGYVNKDNIMKLAATGPKDRPFVPILIFVDPKGNVREKVFGNDPTLSQAPEIVIKGAIGAIMQEFGIPLPGPQRKQ